MKYIKIFEEYNSSNEKISNDELIEKISKVLNNNDNDEMYNLLKYILYNSYYSDDVPYINIFLKILKDREFYPHSNLPPVSINPLKEIRSILYQVRNLLNNNIDLKDIRIYTPNCGSPHFNVNNRDMSFN